MHKAVVLYLHMSINGYFVICSNEKTFVAKNFDLKRRELYLQGGCIFVRLVYIIKQKCIP